MILTRWSSLYNIFSPEIITSLPAREIVSDKMKGVGISGCTFKDGWCVPHQTTKAHRCASSVDMVHTAIFDADHGTHSELAWTVDKLTRAGVEFYAYPTFSDSLAKMAYRVIIPLSVPIPPSAWPKMRAALANAYKIPADLDKCTAPHHFFFGPVKPAAGDRNLTYVNMGNPYQVSAILTPDELTVKPTPTLEPHTLRVPTNEYRNRDTLTNDEFAEALERNAHRLNTKGVLKTLVKAHAGLPLAEAGSRNNTTFKVAGIMAWLFRDHTTEAILEALRPSIEAMQAAGSGLTVDSVSVMIQTAADNCDAKRDEEEAEKNKFTKLVTERINGVGH